MSLKKLDFRVDLCVKGNDGKEVGKKYCTATIEVPKGLHKQLLDIYSQEYLEDYATTLMMILTCPDLLHRAIQETDRRVVDGNSWRSR